MLELLGDIVAIALGIALAAVIAFASALLKRFPLLMLALGIALLAVPVAWYGGRDGQGFVLWLLVVVFVGFPGVFYATYGLVLLTNGLGGKGPRVAVSLVAVISLAVFTTIAMHERRLASWRATSHFHAAGAVPPGRIQPAAEPGGVGKGGAEQARARSRYEECVAFRREAYRMESLQQCADELVRGWDASHSSRQRFANMPDGAAFA